MEPNYWIRIGHYFVWSVVCLELGHSCALYIVRRSKQSCIERNVRINEFGIFTFTSVLVLAVPSSFIRLFAHTHTHKRYRVRRKKSCLQPIQFDQNGIFFFSTYVKVASAFDFNTFFIWVKRCKTNHFDPSPSTHSVAVRWLCVLLTLEF